MVESQAKRSEIDRRSVPQDTGQVLSKASRSGQTVDSVQAPDSIALDIAVEHLNKISEIGNRQYSFEVNDKLDQVVVQVKDDHGDVIRQFPSETAIQLRMDVERMIGLFLDQLA